MKSSIFTFALLFSCLTTFSQTWYFGYDVGIKFTEDGIQDVPNEYLNTKEGCAVANDDDGNARLYTDGSTVWSIDPEGNHNVVLNGTDLNGDPSSTQSAIIVPLPGSDCNRYAVFTVDNAEELLVGGLQYSIVDFTSNQQGVIFYDEQNPESDDKNIPLARYSSEKLTAYSMDDDRFWVLAHGFLPNSNDPNLDEDEGRKFFAYLIDGPDVPALPVTSIVGISHEPDNSLGYPYGTAQGQMKFSHDGKKVALTLSQGGGESGKLVQVFDFDLMTGEVSNPITINFGSNEYPYGVEFAPGNNNILYVSSTNVGIYQVNLEGLNLGPSEPYDISEVSTQSVSLRNNYALQLGPDDNIYIARNEEAFIGQISNPDVIGGFVYSTIDIAGTCRIGLPTVIQGNFVCKKACGEIVTNDETESINFNCPNSYTYTFQLKNNLEGIEVTSALIHSITPEGVTLSNQFFNFFQDPIEPGGTSGDLEIEISLESLLTEDLEVCFEITYFSSEDECCHFEHCIVLEAVDPCESVSVVEVLETEESCCYEVYLNNDFCPDFFTGLRIESNTEGVIFSDFEEIGGWTASLSEDMTSILWTQGAGSIPLGALDPLSFCLDGVTSEDQFPQVVTLYWLGIDPATGEEIVYCEEKLEFECKPCLFISGDVVCADGNGHTYDFIVTNNSEQTASMLVFEVHTPNVWFSPPMIMLPVELAEGESYTGSVQVSTINGNPLPPNTEVTFKVLLMDLNGWCCHSEEISIRIPRCNIAQGPLTPIRSHVAEPVQIYPNPATQLMRLTVPNEGRYSITIFDTNGKQMANYRDYLYQRQPFELDVSGLVNGVYFIRLENQDGVMEQRRFIKTQ